LAALAAWPRDRLRWLRVSQHYRMSLVEVPQVVFQEGWGTDWVTSVCVVRVPDGAADQVEADLAEAGVQTRRWWGGGCHRMPAFSRAPRAALPATEQLAGSTLGLPMAIDLAHRDLDRVAASLARSFAGVA
jgi:dTDP-4-amino-4,6-dideoxygalactose transaminase